MIEDYKYRILNEYDALNRRLSDLEAMVGSDKFEGMDATTQGLLLEQSELMGQYLYILKVRAGMEISEDDMREVKEESLLMQMVADAGFEDGYTQGTDDEAERD